MRLRKIENKIIRREQIRPPQEKCPRCGSLHDNPKCPQNKINRLSGAEINPVIKNNQEKQDNEKIEEIRDKIKQIDHHSYLDHLLDNSTTVERERKFLNDKIQQRMELDRTLYGGDLRTRDQIIEADRKFDETIRNSRFVKWLRKLIYGK